MENESKNMFVRRKYFAADRDEASPYAEAEVEPPTKSPDGIDFMCRIHLRWPGSDESETVYGVDELQALELALGNLKAMLRRLEGSADVKLKWEGGEAGDLGIQIPDFSD